MESVASIPPLIVIVGQTGSGKSALALQLAEQFSGEIIAADSRTVYKGMNVGTAKPSAEDIRLVPHHLIDIIEPGEQFSVADFQRLAQKAILEITSRGHVPILVGGSGLYVDSVLYGFGFRAPANLSLRASLQQRSVEELQEMILEKGLDLPANDRNPRHLMRSIEAAGSPPPTRQTLRSNTLVIGLTADKAALATRLEHRAEKMLADGLVDEVRLLTEKYGQVEALRAPAYREVRLYLSGAISFDELSQLIVRSHMQYAKRQRTWFKRSEDVMWISKPEESVEFVTTFLNNIL